MWRFKWYCWLLFYTTSVYHRFLLTLMNAHLCMVNGRVWSSNDFTSMSVKGSEVVDYCNVSHASLCKFPDFSVTLTSEVINNLWWYKYISTNLYTGPLVAVLDIFCNSVYLHNAIMCEKTTSDDLKRILDDFLSSTGTVLQID